MRRRNFAANFLPPSGGDRIVRAMYTCACACVGCISHWNAPKSRSGPASDSTSIAVVSIHGRTTGQSTTPSVCERGARGEYERTCTHVGSVHAQCVP